MDSLQLAETKKDLMRKDKTHIPMHKIKGREDNLVYNINEGYNLQDGDGTFFDKYKIKDLFSGSPTASNSSLPHTSAMIMRNLERQKRSLT